MQKLIWAILTCLIGLSAYAEQVEVPEEELSSETVLPVFDQRRIVLNRNIQKTKRFELGGGFGMALNEPFYDPKNVALLAAYHWDEMHGLNFQYNSFLEGLSTYGEQLKSGEAGGIVFNPEKAPDIRYIAMLNYQFDAYYGKISLSKKAIMNLSLFGSFGGGMIGFDGLSKPGLNIGMGQNFYITKNFSIRYDLRLLVYNGPDATSQDLTNSSNPTPDSFDDELFFNTLLSVGASFLL